MSAKEPIMATEKQLAANRRNSQKASGPRNSTRSRYNTKPPARETTLTTAKTEPKTSQPTPGKRL
jgi:hypothetical protein